MNDRMRQRRFLPSLSQLIAFEAVMRHRSVTAAADELHLTQSTVSRLVASLERQLGKPLFTRDRKRLTPTAEAAVSRIIRSSSSSWSSSKNGSSQAKVVPLWSTVVLSSMMAPSCIG